MSTVLDEFKVAKGWNELPFRAVAQKVSEIGFPELDSLSVFLDAGVVPRSSREDNHNQLGESLDKYQRVMPNDLVFNKLRTWQGGFGISNYEGIVSPAYIIARPDRSLVEPRFLGYLLKSKPYLAELTRLSKWMPPSQFDISWESIRGLKLRIPPIEEQQRIADFLDVHLKKIDKAIELKKILRDAIFDSYNSYRHQLVTGFKESPKVKSNLDWIPEVPQSWLKLPLRALFSWHKGKDPARLDNSYCESNPGEYPVYSGQTGNSGVFGLINSFDFSFVDKCTLVSTVGAQAGTMRIVSGQFSLSQNCALLIPKSSSSNAAYLYYLWPSIWSSMKSKIPSDMQPSLRLSDLSDTWLFLPPAHEQKEIIKLLTKQEEGLNATDAALDDSLLKLEELKVSLITSAVTGTRDDLFGRGVA